MHRPGDQYAQEPGEPHCRRPVRPGVSPAGAGERDGRNVFVRPVEDRLEDFLAVHRRSLALVRQIIDVVGREDAESFVRMAEKLSQAGLQL